MDTISRAPCSGITGRGQSSPWHFSHGNLCRPTGKRGARKKGKIVRKRRKIWKGKDWRWKGEVWKWAADFACHFLKPLLGSTKWTVFTGKKYISCWGQIRKSDFPPSKKYSSYATSTIGQLWVQTPFLPHGVESLDEILYHSDILPTC